ncbi:hypothetical protein LJK87_08970 [Paenibacillus sp. P25]|nr:hypothetical protein LJK87_08970 [Paenibacillus sp. P25]
MARAGPAAAESIRQLIQAKQELMNQLQQASGIVSQYEQLLQDLLRYAESLGILKLKSESDFADLAQKKDVFQEAMKAGKKANDELNAEIGRVKSDSGSLAADQVFGQIKLFSREDLDRYEADVGTAVSLYSSVHAQIGDGVLFTQQKYNNTQTALDSFLQKVQEIYSRENAAQTERSNRTSANKTAKKEQRAKAQTYLDQIKRGLGDCSIIDSVDPYREQYAALQGDPAQPGSKGYFQAYLELNQALADSAPPVPQVDLKDADKAGLSAMKLVASLGDLLTDVRDEFYVDEFAVSKFNYRTLGLEKDASGAVKVSKELSRPEQHPLSGQEVEYLLYGSSTCAGNQSFAYAEMFAFRLAVGMTEAMLKPRNEMLAAGSPPLVVLVAVAEGAVQAQKDMSKLIQGETVPLSKELGSALMLGYKDYLRLFLLLHSREATLLSRMQAPLQLNTGMDLNRTTTYVSGSASTSFRLWFMPRVMHWIGKSGFSGCETEGSRRRMTRTADFTY